MEFNDKTTVGEVVTKDNRAFNVFFSLEIDFCCDGEDNLFKALDSKDTTIEKFEELLGQVKHPVSNKENIMYDTYKKEELIKSIVEHQHKYAKMMMSKIDPLFLGLLVEEGKDCEILFDVYKLFGHMKSDLAQHLIKEETIDFLKIINAKEEAEVDDIVNMLKDEHEDVGHMMEEMVELTDWFNLSDNSSEKAKEVFKLLDDLVVDTHFHIHLENNILFKEI